MDDGRIDIENLRQVMQGDRDSLWVFGYASLIWKPGFAYKQRVVGYVTGYKRRFFQGTTTHRGTVDWPGRVGTLLPAEEDEIVWGVAYEVKGIEEIRMALEHLAEREMITGGYHFDQTTFTPLSGMAPLDIQVYIADCSNKQYLGDAPLALQAYQIFKARGVCGHNIEYVRKVGDFMRTEVPNGVIQDAYLSDLESLLHRLHMGELRLSQSELDQLPILVQEARVDREWAAMKLREASDSKEVANHRICVVREDAPVARYPDDNVDPPRVAKLDGIGA